MEGVRAPHIVGNTKFDAKFTDSGIVYKEGRSLIVRLWDRDRELRPPWEDSPLASPESLITQSSPRPGQEVGPHYTRGRTSG
ncbi:hypothetical protein J6590_044772 [Homalodisca vitripennis]|nr:hypothetical protein J6590_044772 [Homalodisca vitripennis]